MSSINLPLKQHRQNSSTRQTSRKIHASDYVAKMASPDYLPRKWSRCTPASIAKPQTAHLPVMTASTSSSLPGVVFFRFLTPPPSQGFVARNYYYLTNRKLLQDDEPAYFPSWREKSFEVSAHGLARQPLNLQPFFDPLRLLPIGLIILIFIVILHGTFIHRRDAPNIHKGKNCKDLSSNKFLGPLLKIFCLLGSHFWLLPSAGSWSGSCIHYINACLLPMTSSRKFHSQMGTQKKSAWAQKNKQTEPCF